MKKAVVILCLYSLIISGCAGLDVKECKDCSPVCRQAKQDVNSSSEAEGMNWGWFAAGAVLLPVGLAIAAIVPVDPPPAFFAGKSREYILEYTKCYRESYSRTNFNSAWAGCTFTGVVGFAAGLGFTLYGICWLLTHWE